MNRLKRISTALSRYSASKGFGVHSPFAFHFIKSVLDEKCPYYSYAYLDEMRDDIIQRTKRSQGFKPRVMPLSEATLLFRVANFHTPSNVLMLGSSYGIAAASVLMVSHKTHIALYDNAAQGNEAARELIGKYANRISIASNVAEAINACMAGKSNDCGTFAVIGNINDNELDEVNKTFACVANGGKGIFFLRDIPTSRAVAQLWKNCKAAMSYGMTFSNDKIAILVVNPKLPRQDFKLWL